jgi:hypothetical protein
MDQYEPLKLVIYHFNLRKNCGITFGVKSYIKRFSSYRHIHYNYIFPSKNYYDIPHRMSFHEICLAMYYFVAK